MRKGTRWIISILIVTLLFAACSGCKKEEPASQLDLGDMDLTEPHAAAPQEGTQAGEQASAHAPAQAPDAIGQAPQSGAVAQVTAAVAYAFEGVLYAACEYQNVGDTPLVLSEAACVLTSGGSTVSESFLPIAAENDVIAPGETGYCTLWLPAEGVKAGAAVSAQARLTAIPAEHPRTALVVSEERLIQNYPGFATLSGKLKNAGSDLCELNVIYAGFYDENGAFLGAWHFTRAVTLKAGDGKAFVSHLRALPIPKLAENTATIKFAAFGL